jgi:hypothetical protein
VKQDAWESAQETAVLKEVEVPGWEKKWCMLDLVGLSGPA